MQYNFDEVIDRTQTDSAKWARNRADSGVADVIPMWVADMDFQSPAPVIQALVRRAQHGIFGYPRRWDSYYDAITGWLHRRHGWDIQRDWIVNAPGVVNALTLAIQALSKPGDKIVVQPPVYHPFYPIVQNHGRQIVLNPLRWENQRYVMDLENLERQIDGRTKLLILCNPHNPVGRVWTRAELEALGEFCARHNLLILSDEIHCDLILREHRHTPIAALSDELAQRTLTFIAPSKTFNLAGLATSVVIAPNEKLRAELSRTIEDYGLHIGNVFGIRALEAGYREGEEWLDQLLVYLEGNVRFAVRFIEERIPRIKPICPEGTYLLWLDCRALGLDRAALNTLMRQKARVALQDGADFGIGGEGFQRLNFACPRSILEQGLARIEAAVNQTSEIC
ncbi:MAG: putative C-S lyase [Chloroflexi bacterium]|nr:putative C-S lyase [Chloroflexota bacterium]